ncbi:hypothetical protein BASA81_006090 [Batrachochytrium salamandrivorans]|nr:hypothetical protein BASA81_006090 [Batrachochytrium salamandrivorans]
MALPGSRTGDIPMAQVVYEAPQYEYYAQPQAQQLSRGFHNNQNAPLPVQISQQEAANRRRSDDQTREIRRRDEDEDCCLAAAVLCCCCCCYS